MPRTPIIGNLMSLALDHHRAGRLSEAEKLYRKILTLDPRHAASLHMLGMIAHQIGQNSVALQLINLAISINRHEASFHSNLGSVYQAMGQLHQAASSYQRALALAPNFAEAEMNLGTILEAQGDLGKAAKRFRRALAIKPTLAEAYINLGNILQMQGKHQAAVQSLTHALQLNPNSAVASFNLGNAHQSQGRFDEAIACYQHALTLEPQFTAAHGNLGNAQQASGNLAAAERSYAHALQLDPHYADAQYNLGRVQQNQNKIDEAILCYQRALNLKPDLPEAHYNLGSAYSAQDRFCEAAACYRRAIELRPRYTAAHYNLGCVLRSSGDLTGAMTQYKVAIQLEPDHVEAHFGLALAHLKNAEFALGWAGYHWRWQSASNDTLTRNYSQPLWKGKKLNGTVYLWGEQGVGDEIQFAGLIPELIARGNTVQLECDKRLSPLFARSFPQIEVVSRATDAEKDAASSETTQSLPSQFVAHLPTGDLPALLRQNESDFAQSRSPYLNADPAQTANFRARYTANATTGLNKLIGLAWHTNNPRTGRIRSIPLETLAPLFQQATRAWVSLQYGLFDALQQQAQSANAPLLIDRTVDQFLNIDLFAAQVASMDLVITIDNSTAHLAGALGMPVWLMLPYASDWRWPDRQTDHHTDSPWYPTMRIFHQPKLHDWESVVTEVAQALKEFCSANAASHQIIHMH
jgi:tetratricopeptide (TPR) repeat protein